MSATPTPSDATPAVDRSAHGLDGAARARAVDAWLVGLADRAPLPRGAALVAVGGHGRGWLDPGSDLDLVLVHPKRTDVAAVAEALWYPIWDAGFPLDHSVRTIDGCLSAGHDDLKVALGLLDARHIAGDEATTADLVGRWQERWRGFAKRHLPKLIAAVADRRDDEPRSAERRDVAFAQEPDLKAGRGGLRDLDALRAARRAGAPCPSADPLGTAIDASLAEAEVVLHRVRAALHLEAGVRKGHASDDVLRAEHRAGVALRLGRTEAEVDLLLSTAARRVDWAADRAWPRVESWLAGPGALWRPSGDRALGHGLVRRDDEVQLAAEATADERADPALALRAAAIGATTGLPLSDGLLAHLTEAARPPRGVWPPGLLAALVELLSSGPGLVAAVEALDQIGVFERYLPEWASVRSRHQRNPFHTWTVDRHLLEATARASSLQRRVRRPDLLVLGALLHDLGKGEPGRDHTDVGVELALLIGRRIGLAADDVDTVSRLVALHLLLPDTATRRDPDDPAVVEGIADALGDVDALELLHALVEADAQATGPTAWTAWRASLVERLCQNVRTALDERVPSAAQPDRDARRHQAASALGLDLRATEQVVLRPGQGPGGTWDLGVVAADRPRLLADVAGALAAGGFDVLAVDLGPAAVAGSGVQLWSIVPGVGAADAPELQAIVAAALDGRATVTDRLERRRRSYPARRGPATAPPEVTATPGPTPGAGWVEVRTGDEIGLLHRLTTALADAGVDVRSARCTTYGLQAVDTFEVGGAGVVLDRAVVVLRAALR